MSTTGGGGDFFADLKGWFDRCPFWTKTILYTCIVCEILEIPFTVSQYFANYPGVTVNTFGIQRLFLSPFFHKDILGLLFGFLAYLGRAAVQERFWGTTKMIVDFFWKTFIINVLFIIVAYLYVFLFNSSFSDYSLGLWPIVFTVIVENAIQNPDGESQLMCLPIVVKTKYYPIFLWLLFCLLSQRIKYDLLVAIAVGYIHGKWFNTTYFNFLNDNKMASWSRSIVFSCLTRLPNYVPPPTAFSYSVDNRGNNGPSNNTQEPSSSFKPYQGRGVTIGGGEREAPSNPGPENRNGYYMAMPEQEDPNNSTSGLRRNEQP